LKPGSGGHQHDLALASGHHGGKQRPGQFGQSHDVNLQHLGDPERIRLVEPAAGAKTGGVDQHVDRQILRFDLANQRGGGATLAEISGNDRAIGTERFEFFGRARIGSRRRAQRTRS